MCRFLLHLTFLHIFVGSSPASVFGGFSSWLVSSRSLSRESELNYYLRPRTRKVTTSKYFLVTISTVSCFVDIVFAVGFTLGVGSVVCINPFSEWLVGLASGRCGTGLAGDETPRIPWIST